MSAPLPLLQVTLTIGYDMRLELRARDQQAAEDIARYLFERRNRGDFRETEHLVIDSVVTGGEVVA